jgi:hypothetical protein
MSIKQLRARVTLPFVRPNGTVVASPGYDPLTCIYADFREDTISAIPAAPSRVEVIEALRTLWAPWSLYPFGGEVDRAAMLAAILTAVCRPALNTAPGFMLEAPTPGSGKTLAATALGALARGTRGGVTPFVDGANVEQEMVKKLVSMLLMGESFYLVDNVVGTWRSPVLASLITDGSMNERLLGGNTWFRGEARLMICATSNNASLDRDLGRRFIRIRIDPGTETPQAREFEFDPAEVTLRDRMKIARAVLVVIQAYTVAGSPRLGRGSCGFSEWAALVRNTVLWVGQLGMTGEAGIGTTGDPAKSILEQAACDDPDTSALTTLLMGLHKHGPGEIFTTREVFRKSQAGENSSDEALVMIAEGVGGLFLGKRDISVIGLGRALNARRDRIAGGLVLRALGTDRTKAQVWGVEEVPVPEMRR